MSIDRANNGELSYAPVRVIPRTNALAPIERMLPALPVSSTAVVAAGSFIAGAAALATLRAARTRRQLRRGRRGNGRALQRRSVVATRSFLVDVHLLGR